MDGRVIKALCVGWVFSGVTVVVTQALQFDLIASLILIMLMGSASTLYVLNK
jgi:ABC-type uncharacterized transport system permease subunit